MNLKRTISPQLAIVTIINAMIGAGVFINLYGLSNAVGSWGFLAYGLGYLLIMPIAFCLGNLAADCSVAGGMFYQTSRYLGTGIGFLAGWAYFLGKIVSAGILCHSMQNFIGQTFPWAAQLPPLLIDGCLLGLIATLNIAGFNSSGMIQKFFSVFKLLPFALLILLGLTWGHRGNLHLVADLPLLVGHWWQAIPLTIFTLTGFEIVLHLGHMLQDPEKTLKQGLILATAIVACLYISFHLAMCFLVGPATLKQGLVFALDWTGMFGSWGSLFGLGINCLVIIAIFSAVFGTINGNSWNLYAIADKQLLPGYHFLTKLNRYNSPWICLLLHITLSMLVIVLCQDVVILQNMSVLAIGSCYFWCCLAGLRHWARSLQASGIIGGALVCLSPLCAMLITALGFYKVWYAGLSIGFCGAFIVGCLLAGAYCSWRSGVEG